METKIFQSGSQMDDEVFFTEMVSRGMMDVQTAGQVINMNKKSKLTKILGEIVIKPFPARRTNKYKPLAAHSGIRKGQRTRISHQQL